MIKAISNGIKYANLGGPLTSNNEAISQQIIKEEGKPSQKNLKPPIQKQLKGQQTHHEQNQFVQKANKEKKSAKKGHATSMCIHRHGSHQNSFQNQVSDSQTIYSTIKNSSRSKLKQGSKH